MYKLHLALIKYTVHCNEDAEIVGMENVGLKIAAPECTGRNRKKSKVWKVMVLKMYF